jgi:hypothetical protein
MKILLFLLLLPTLIHAQLRADTIAFTLNNQSNICIKARIDDSDTLILMFHTAANDIMLTRTAIKNKIIIKLDKADTVRTWGGMAISENSEHHSFFINKMAWKDMTVFADDNSGAGTDGKFGYDLFKGKIVAIDYDKKRMIVSETLPKKLRTYSKLKMTIKRGSIFMVGTLNTGKMAYQDDFMFHSGYGQSILIDPKIAEKYDMYALKTIESSELKDSFNNTIKIEVKEIPEVQIGDKKIKNVPMSVASKSSEIPMKVFGNDLLKRFNVVFDFQKFEIYLKPNKLWNEPYFKKS